MNAVLFVEIDELVRTADAEGVDLDLDVEEDGDMTSIWLGSIERTSGPAGAGARALERLIDFCSERSLALEGAIEPPNRRLEDYYSLHGFEIEQHGNRTIITRTP